MNRKRFILYVLLAFGIVAIAVLGFNYAVVLRERKSLTKTLELLSTKAAEYKIKMTKNQEAFDAKITDLMKEKEVLEIELEGAKQKFNQTQTLLSKAKQDIEALKGENSVILQKVVVLEETIFSLKEEKLELERKLSSLKELNNAMREVKARKTKQKIENAKTRDQEALYAGNRGYIIKDGKPTTSLKYIIRVLPAKTGFDEK